MSNVWSRMPHWSTLLQRWTGAMERHGVNLAEGLPTDRMTGEESMNTTLHKCIWQVRNCAVRHPHILTKACQ